MLDLQVSVVEASREYRAWVRVISRRYYDGERYRLEGALLPILRGTGCTMEVSGFGFQVSEQQDSMLQTIRSGSSAMVPPAGQRPSPTISFSLQLGRAELGRILWIGLTTFGLRECWLARPMVT